MPSVELHLWIRELTPDRPRGRDVAAFFWSDDGSAPLGTGEDGGDSSTATSAVFPAIYCRHCGRVRVGRHAVAGQQQRPRHQRRRHPTRPRHRRGTVPCAAAGARRGRAGARRGGGRRSRRRGPALWTACAGSTSPSGSCSRPPAGRGGPGRLGAAGAHARRRGGGRRLPQRPLPGVPAADGIRFLGSAVATQLSVALSTLFGSTNLDAGREEDPGLHRQRAGRRAPGWLRAEPVAQPDRALGAAGSSRRRRHRARHAGRAGHRACRGRPVPALPRPPARPGRQEGVRAVLGGQDAGEGPAERAQAGRASGCCLRRRPGVRPAVPARPHPGDDRQPSPPRSRPRPD